MYSSQQEVLVDGTVNLPQAGSISVSGMTLEEAAKTPNPSPEIDTSGVVTKGNEAGASTRT
ncbi:MAG: polysaccharide biosynthesis/export family protein [Limnospira maxima]